MTPMQSALKGVLTLAQMKRNTANQAEAGKAPEAAALVKQVGYMQPLQSGEDLPGKGVYLRVLQAAAQVSQAVAADASRMIPAVLHARPRTAKQHATWRCELPSLQISCPPGL